MNPRVLPPGFLDDIEARMIRAARLVVRMDAPEWLRDDADFAELALLVHEAVQDCALEALRLTAPWIKKGRYVVADQAIDQAAKWHGAEIARAFIKAKVQQ